MKSGFLKNLSLPSKVGHADSLIFNLSSVLKQSLKAAIRYFAFVAKTRLSSLKIFFLLDSNWGNRELFLIMFVSLWVVCSKINED